MKSYDEDFVVLGAGAGGLVVAQGLAQMGKQVLLIEKASWGGDCTHYGCIPSKTLIASAKVAHHIREAEKYGIHPLHGSSLSATEWSFEGAFRRAQKVVSHFEQQENPAALEQKGLRTLMGEAQFLSPHSLRVSSMDGGESQVFFKKLILATGSEPLRPKLPGLNPSSYLTNETLFSLSKPPSHLAVVGGGPIGCEMGLCFARLGSKVTIIESGESILAMEEPETQSVVKELFEKEGIEVFTNARVLHITGESTDRSAINFAYNGDKKIIDNAAILLAAGRQPSIDNLRLEDGGVQFTKRGISVNAYGQSSQSHIWAVGDCAAVDGYNPMFTHMAEHQARVVLFNLLVPKIFRRKQVHNENFPRAIYLDPEVASFGLSEKQAIARYGSSRVATYKIALAEVDRAHADGYERGFIKVTVYRYSSKILGASIAAPHAAELINELSLAQAHGISLRKIASLIHPYPSYSMGLRKVADLAFKDHPLSHWVRKL